MLENDVLLGTQALFGAATYIFTKDTTISFGCAAGLAFLEVIRSERSAALQSMFTMSILAILANVGRLEAKSITMVAFALFVLCIALYIDAIKKDKKKDVHNPNKALRNLCGVPVFGPRFALIFGKVYRQDKSVLLEHIC
jgi:hypothetical protein